MATKLIYKGNRANLPATREENAFYLCVDTRELFFGADLYTEAVRFYTGEKPTAPAQGVLYIHENTGAGDVWNGTAWVSVFKAYATTIDANADHTTVPTTKATKDYVDQKVADVVAGEVGTLGELASKDKVTEDELATGLKDKIDGKADQTDLDATDGKVDTLIGDDAGKSARTIANEELAKQLIPENAKESLDTLAELAAWIQDHPDDVTAINKAISDLEALVGELPEDATATDVVGYIKEYADSAIAALKIGDYAKAADLTALAARVTDLETDTHTHENKDLLDTYTQTEEDLADAVTKKHDHDNAEELAKITAGDVAKWDAVADALTVGTF